MKRFINFFLSIFLLFTVATSQVSYAQSPDYNRYEERSRKDILLDGGYLNLSAYQNSKHRYDATTGRGGTYVGPNGTTLSRDRGVNSYGGTHGGSYWKLHDRNNKRIGTYDKNGKPLR